MNFTLVSAFQPSSFLQIGKRNGFPLTTLAWRTLLGGPDKSGNSTSSSSATQLMMLTVRYMRTKHTNDWCEVTNDLRCSEVQGQDLRVINDEFERREDEVNVYKCFGTGGREVQEFRKYESCMPIVGILRE